MTTFHLPHDSQKMWRCQGRQMEDFEGKEDCVEIQSESPWSIHDWKWEKRDWRWFLVSVPTGLFRTTTFVRFRRMWGATPLLPTNMLRGRGNPPSIHIFAQISRMLIFVDLRYLESSVETIFHDGYKFFVAEIAISINVKQLEDCIHYIITQYNICTHFHCSLEFSWNYTSTLDVSGILRNLMSMLLCQSYQGARTSIKLSD